MTNDPDMTHVFDVTKGYCEKHGQTRFECVKCTADAQKQAVDVDLATIAELHEARANMQEIRRLTQLRQTLTVEQLFGLIAEIEMVTGWSEQS